jgi:hypothetical protein
MQGSATTVPPEGAAAIFARNESVQVGVKALAGLAIASMPSNKATSNPVPQKVRALATAPFCADRVVSDKAVTISALPFPHYP